MTRRQEKVARIVKEAVSDAIANHLNDPRIEGFVSVTRVEMAADLRSADVYLSIFSKHRSSEDEGGATEPAGDSGPNKTFLAISHAKSKIQSLVADRLHSKFCPVLHFHTDEKFKKTMETMRLIEQASRELKREDSADEQVE
ncbi:MAG: 30S ribosome-binding factor RbfA [Planctomycetota bacterium]